MSRLPEALGWLLVAMGVVLVLIALACTFVFLVMVPPTGDTSYHPEVRPPAAQPGPPVSR